LEEGSSVLKDRRRCGWGFVLATVTVFATVLLVMPVPAA
jgi:hypothetical protein